MPLIRQLTTDDAGALSALLQTSSQDDQSYFHPFDFDVETIRRHLAKSVLDQFFGTFLEPDCTLAGFHMLRGLDEGYESPVYGVFVSSRHRGCGLGRLSLYHAIAIAKLKQCPSLLLNVYQENLRARQLYESAGFSVCSKKNNSLRMQLLLPISNLSDSSDRYPAVASKSDE